MSVVATAEKQHKYAKQTNVSAMLWPSAIQQIVKLLKASVNYFMTRIGGDTVGVVITQNLQRQIVDGYGAHVLVVGGSGGGVSVSNEVVVATITEYISVGIEVQHNFH